MRRTTLLLAGLLVFLVALPAHAVTITIVNKDAAGQGLNDPTPATPVGGNPGTTIGQQRLNVLQEGRRYLGRHPPRERRHHRLRLFCAALVHVDDGRPRGDVAGLRRVRFRRRSPPGRLVRRGRGEPARGL